jgi:hypothetical protein
MECWIFISLMINFFCPMPEVETQMRQGGCRLITDAYVKGLKIIDYKLALKAMLNGTDVAPVETKAREAEVG